MPIDPARRLWWAVFLTYAAAVCVVSVIPVVQVGPRIPSFDKLFHLIEYALFGWLLARAQLASGRPWPHVARMAVIGAAVYGAALELVQAMLPYRDAEWLDAVTNAVGGIVGIQLIPARLRNLSRG